MRSIARSLDRSPSTVTREVAANGGRECYRIWPAHQRAAVHQAPEARQARKSSVMCESNDVARRALVTKRNRESTGLGLP